MERCNPTSSTLMFLTYYVILWSSLDLINADTKITKRHPTDIILIKNQNVSLALP